MTNNGVINSNGHPATTTKGLSYFLRVSEGAIKYYLYKSKNRRILVPDKARVRDENGKLLIALDLIGNKLKKRLDKNGYTDSFFRNILRDLKNEKSEEKKKTEATELIERIENMASKYRIGLLDPTRKFLSNNSLHKKIDPTACKAALLMSIKYVLKEGIKKNQLREVMKALHKSDPFHFPQLPTSPGKFNKLANTTKELAKDKDFIRLAIDWRSKSSQLNRMIIGKPSDVEDENIFIPKTFINLAEFHARKLIYLHMNPGQPNKLDFESVYIRYEIHCQQEGVAPCDISTVKKFLSKDAVKLYTSRERHGMKAFDKMLPHTKGKKPTYSLSKGGYDGFQVDFYTRHDKKQVMLTVVAVFDYMSWAITGYDVGIVEDGLMVRNMYRNHLNQNDGYSYMEIESDRFSGNLAGDTRSILESCCQKITQPKPNDPVFKDAPNPKARYVERILQEFNRMTQSYPGWKGTNFHTRDASRRPNQNYMKNSAVETIEEGIKQVIDLVEVYNNQKLKKLNGKSRMELFRENMNPAAPQIPAWSRAQILNKSTKVAVRSGVVSIEVNRRTYEYDFHDYDQYIGQLLKGYRVEVYYDESNMDTVDVFGQDERYIATLSAVNRFKKSKAEQTPEDLKEFGRQIAQRNKTRDNIDRKSLEVMASVHGVEIGGLPLKEARERVFGAIAQSGEEIMLPGPRLHAEVLQSEEAQRSANYYTDRMLTARDMKVPEPVETGEDERSKYIRNKFSKNSKRPISKTPEVDYEDSNKIDISDLVDTGEDPKSEYIRSKYSRNGSLYRR